MASLLPGLSPATTYHYRFIGENGTGPTQGNDVAFKTENAIIGLSTDPATLLYTDAVVEGVDSNLHLQFFENELVALLNKIEKAPSLEQRLQLWLQVEECRYALECLTTLESIRRIR